MSIYFTSDLHYSHARVILYCNRPFSSVEEMNEKLIANHNAIVKPNDEVYFLGDFCFGKLAEIKTICRRLNGKKSLILGNHDKEIIRNIPELLHYKSFERIVPYYELNYNKQKIILFHYGMRVWNKSHHGSWHLFGHSHSSLPSHGLSVDVGVDSTWVTGKAEYRPFSFDEIARFMNTREMSVVDHHGKEREEE